MAGKRSILMDQILMDNGKRCQESRCDTPGAGRETPDSLPVCGVKETEMSMNAGDLAAVEQALAQWL